MHDLVTGKRQYGEFLDSPEGIATNILADRLKRLEDASLVTKGLYQTTPVRHEYRLTPSGLALLPVLQEICRWANAQIPGTWIPSAGFMKRKRDTRRS